MTQTIQTLTLTFTSALLLACASGANTSTVPQAPQVTHSSAQSATSPEPSKSSAVTLTATPDRSTVRDALATRRAAHIDRLKAYATAGVFPQNRERPGMLRIFMGDDGAICAVANLIWQSGGEQLVRKTAASNNYISLIDVRDGALLDWMLQSGFTRAEIDRIQEPGDFLGERLSPLAEDPALASEIERKRAQIAVVIAELMRNADASLDAAIDAVMAEPALVASL